MSLLAKLFTVLGAKGKRIGRLLATAVLAALPLLMPEPELRAQTDAAPITIMVGPGQDAAGIDAAVKAAGGSGRPVVLQWQETGGTNKAAAAEDRPQPVVAVDGMWMLRDLLSALNRGTARSIAGIAGLPAAFSSSWSMLSAESDGPIGALFAAFGAAAGGLTVAWTVRALLATALRRSVLHHRFWIAMVRLTCDAVAVVAYVAVAHALLRQLLAPETLSRQVASSLLWVLAGTLTYAAIGRLLFTRNGETLPPLLDIDHARWHFRMLVAYGTLNAFIASSVQLADVRMVDPVAADSWLFLTASILTVLKLWWFIAGRHDIARVFAGRETGSARRLIGSALATFYIVSAVAIWIAGLLVAGTSQNGVWARAAGAMQFIVVVVPILDLGIVSLLGAIARRRERKSGRDLATLLLWSLRMPIAGAIWIAGLHVVVLLWQPLMMGASALVTGWLVWLEHLSLALIVSWSICSFLFGYFETVAPAAIVLLPGQQEDLPPPGTSRIATILPVVRNLILGAVLAIAGLVVISSAGVDVTPLLAGFGVLGLALSFGSQTLVKDVVSGIFFLAEDAFRIGEYIDTGKLMGTVEQISLRSVRLRHHNGPIHTIPFGTITSVTNFSRDWGTIKFELRFEPDADLELIRKTAKKVGLGLLEHPDFGNDFLVPLKMQGIQAVTESSMVVRFKFTSRPGNPSLIKREGMKRLLTALKEAGLPLASTAVVVRSGTGHVTENAATAAASTVIPMPANQV
ncbi:mechanosensitive ion channel domain-containing protein [Rhizobium sp. 0TCS1.26]|uniref:mechanosensitive ion channel family protein n=1 Tax=Rhizobium sp. 0TCS1.26 TaxID=3142623 RepID=UPI003D271FB6